MRLGISGFFTYYFVQKCSTFTSDLQFVCSSSPSIVAFTITEYWNLLVGCAPLSSESSTGRAGQDRKAHQVHKRQRERKASGQTGAVSASPASLMDENARKDSAENKSLRFSGFCLLGFSTNCRSSPTSLKEFSASSFSPASLSAFHP